MKMRKNTVRFLLVAMLVLSFALPVFAQGMAEDAAYAEKYANSAASQKTPNPVLFRPDWFGGNATTRPSVSGKQIVGASHPRATMAGYNILAAGGTAMDAAVAIAGVQSMVDPSATQFLGGDAEILYYNAAENKVYNINGTGWAPAKATIDYYVEEAAGIPDQGPLAVQVPGSWAGWMTLLEMGGTLPLEDVLAPVVETASGYYIDQTGVGMDWRSAKNAVLNKTANEAFIEVFTNEKGEPYGIGDVYTNPDLVKTLNSLIAASKEGKDLKEGYKLAKDYYYRGPLAHTIADWFAANGGLIEYEDLADYDVEILEPWKTTYNGYEILVCPPNSQGPSLLEAFNILENFDMSKFELNSAEYVDLLAQTLNLVLKDRNDFNGDPRFVKFPMETMTKEYAAERAKQINLGHAMETIPEGGFGKSYDGDTTFFYVADKWGNIVIATHSLCNFFGCYNVVDGTGILMNNRMIYFSLEEDAANSLQPRKRTVQTITPTMGFKDGKPAFVCGTPGGDNQVQEILQVLLAYFHYGKTNPQAAIENLRFTTKHPAGLMNHNEFPKTINVEQGYSDKAIMGLEDMGYIVKFSSGMSIGFCVFDGEYKWGGYDPRIYGYTVAW